MSHLIEAMSQLELWLKEYKLEGTIKEVVLDFKGRNLSFMAADQFRHELKDFQVGPDAIVQGKTETLNREGWRVCGIPLRFAGEKQK